VLLRGNIIHNLKLVKLMETDFQIKVGEFQGPLETLLELIEKRKMHINDVSLAEVADAFIEHVKMQEDFPMADSADFILIASTLLLIKSKSLLPNLELTEEEKGNIENLEERLALYKKFKEVGLLIKDIFGKKPLYFAQVCKERRVIFSPSPEITPESIFTAVQSALNNAPKEEMLPKVSVKKTISLEEMIDNLKSRVEKTLKLSFKDFSNGDKIHMIVSFLAILELAKQGIVRINQEKHFDDISIESETLSVPKY